MKLSQTILTGIVVVSAMQVNAQTTFIISAGISPALYSATDDYEENSSSDLKMGFYGGANAHIVMNKHFSFEPGLSFVQKGGIEKMEGSSYNTTLNLNYIELPMDFVYTRRNKFFIGAGPSISWAISGTFKIEDEQKINVKFGSDAESDLKRFDAGLNLMAGFRFNNGFCISTNVNTSLLNLGNESSVNYYNGYWGFRIGYEVGKN